MAHSLSEAIEFLQIQPGQTYRETVNGRTVEVRVLDEATSRFLDEPIMLQPWAEFPFVPIATLTSKQGPPQLPEPFTLTDSDLAPE